MSYEDMDPSAVEHSLAIVKSALSLFGDGMTAMHLGPHFTCSEAEDIANAMRQLGLEEEAEVWLDGHGDGDDDPEDMHYKGGENE